MKDVLDFIPALFIVGIMGLIFWQAYILVDQSQNPTWHYIQRDNIEDTTCAVIADPKTCQLYLDNVHGDGVYEVISAGGYYWIEINE